MTEKTIRKTQARAVERERKRRQEERNRYLKIAIPLFVVIAAMFAFGFSLLTQAKPARPAHPGVVGPRIQVDHDQLDFGYQHLGATVSAQFNVKNVGDDTLNLEVPRTVTLLEGC